MSAGGEAAGDVLTGGVIARTVEGASNAAGVRQNGSHQHTCLNCGSDITGAYCSNCGQSAHVHRSLVSLGHDILHGVFHFEGKLWQTLPELFLRPGRLTRRYIDGERAKFVSPMALFLFTVFFMFAIFAVTGGALVGNTTIDKNAIRQARVEWQTGPLEATQEEMAEIREELNTPDLTPERRAALAENLRQLEASRKVMQALQTGQLEDIGRLDEEFEAAAAQAGDTTPKTPGELKLERGIKQVTENPELLLYKLKTNGYKFSWALIPMSVPFLWLLFFWRRDVHMYDHAVFATYSITFMMMLLILLSIAAAVGVSGGWLAVIFGIAAPWHLSRHLRGTYRLSRSGTWLRMFFLGISIIIVITLFTVLLFIIGVLD